MNGVIFLDFDSVMVTDRYQDQLTDAGSPLRDGYGAKFDPACVELLKEIIDDCPLLDFFREDLQKHLFKVHQSTGLDESTTRKVIEHVKENDQ